MNSYIKSSFSGQAPSSEAREAEYFLPPTVTAAGKEFCTRKLNGSENPGTGGAFNRGARRWGRWDWRVAGASRPLYETSFPRSNSPIGIAFCLIQLSAYFIKLKLYIRELDSRVGTTTSTPLWDQVEWMCDF
ncbi:Uncharacterized protein HZ326_29189 [Fusarium oxysporum f. sp. albedinis]|nr:Uncharacterized protein HZ326_29189 [Fusarium oxysporum f. sp. albedinis]